MRDSATRRSIRGLLAAAFIFAGAWHFKRPEMYRQIIPPGFPSPSTLVIVSGIFEIIGGAGLLVPRLRKPAGWGLIALLIAVFPANIYMAARPHRGPAAQFAPWMLWLRLPIQGVLIAAVAYATRLKNKRDEHARPAVVS